MISGISNIPVTVTSPQEVLQGWLCLPPAALSGQVSARAGAGDAARDAAHPPFHAGRLYLASCSGFYCCSLFHLLSPRPQPPCSSPSSSSKKAHSLAPGLPPSNTTPATPSPPWHLAPPSCSKSSTMQGHTSCRQSGASTARRHC